MRSTERHSSFSCIVLNVHSLAFSGTFNCIACSTTTVAISLAVMDLVVIETIPLFDALADYLPKFKL